MLFHYLLRVLLPQVVEGPFLRKKTMLVEEIEKVCHLKLYVIIVVIRVILGLSKW